MLNRRERAPEERSRWTLVVTFVLTFLAVAAAAAGAAPSAHSPQAAFAVPATVLAAPVANPDAYTTDEDTPLTVSGPGVLENDTDADPPPDWIVCANENELCDFVGDQEVRYGGNDGTNDVFTTPRVFTNGVACNNDVFGDPLPGVVKHCERRPLRLLAILVAGPSHGTLDLKAHGGFVYTPDANFNGDDSFTYKANDGSSDSNVATVSLTVTAVEDGPVAGDDAYSTQLETPLTVPAPGVLANDVDAEGQPLTATVVRAPFNGTLTLDPNGGFTYTPAAGFTGHDSFTYTANDGGLDSNLALVTFTVSPPPPPPAPPPPPSPPPAPPPPPAAPPPPPPPPPPAARPARCLVPNVKGKTLPTARRLLAARKCRLGKVTRAYSVKVRRGRVIAQSPRAGRSLPRATKVNVRVSRGKRR